MENVSLDILICEDHPPTAEDIYQLAKDYFAKKDQILTTFSIYHDGLTLLSDFLEGKAADIIFLDIELPSLSGMEVAQKIRQANSDILIVFVTNYSDYMSASFQVEAFDFLTKPVYPEAFNQVLDRCVRKYTQKYGQITLHTSLGVARIHLSNVFYIASDKHYLDFFMTNGKTVRTQMTLNELEQQLEKFPQFARCHQSYLVNMNYVIEVQRERLFIQQSLPGTVLSIPISRKYSKLMRERFLCYHSHI